MESQGHAQAYLCGLRVGRVGVNAGSDARRGHDGWVVAIIASDCEQVFGSKVDTQALY